MVDSERFSSIALALPDAISAPHFDRIAFKVEKKRIFATLHVETKTANLKLSPADQSVFCLIDKNEIYAVPNKWGLQGWTTFELGLVKKPMMLDALDVAYREVFKAKGKG